MQNQIKEIQNLLIKDLQLSPESNHDILSSDKLKAWLTYEIRLLMDQDFQLLLNMLYRIDISEQKAKEAFSNLNPAERLAELVLARELQKVETRKNINDDFFSTTCSSLVKNKKPAKS